MNYETAAEIEVAVAEWFGVRAHVMVPNVSWGFLNYEADILVLTASAYVWEVEIKVSRGDLRRDQHKRHNHDSDRVKRLWFAIPDRLRSCVELIPERAGVIVVDNSGGVFELRPPTETGARKLTTEECFALARLGALRVWSLKKKILSVTAARVLT